MTLATALTSSGLILDIVGAVLLWRFGLPAEVRRHGQSYLALVEVDLAEIAKAKSYDRLGHTGIALLVLGFVLQLVATFTT